MTCNSLKWAIDTAHLLSIQFKHDQRCVRHKSSKDNEGTYLG